MKTKAFDTALRLLNRREHGAKELYHKLQGKGFKHFEIQEAIHYCMAMDLQNDCRFAELVVRSRIRQGYGPLKITQELQTKGLDHDLIEHVLEQELEHWLDYAKEVWLKKTKAQSHITYEELQKYQRFLLYRGFPIDIITMLIKELKRTHHLYVENVVT